MLEPPFPFHARYFVFFRQARPPRTLGLLPFILGSPMFRRHLLALCACPCLVVFSLACGGGGDDDDDDDSGPGASVTTTPVSTPAGGSPTASASVATTAAPALAAPASKYTLLLADVGAGYFTDRSHTFALTIENYAPTAAFPSPVEGKKLLQEWGYVGGFETAYEPEGRETDVLNGKYYVAVETHLFNSVEGAGKAFTYFENALKGARRAEQVQTQAVGNQSSAWKLTDTKIRGSSINGVFHRFVLRRGNMVAIVQTWGAETFMRVDAVRGLAAILDQKALGQKEALEPTPTPGP